MCEGVLRPSRFTTGDGCGFHGSRALNAVELARARRDETARVAGRIDDTAVEKKEWQSENKEQKTGLIGTGKVD